MKVYPVIPPIVTIKLLPEQTEEKLEALDREIKARVRSLGISGLQGDDCVVLDFPIDMRKKISGRVLHIDVDGYPLFTAEAGDRRKKPERLTGILTLAEFVNVDSDPKKILGDALVAVVKDFFPNTFIRCFIRRFEFRSPYDNVAVSTSDDEEVSE